MAALGKIRCGTSESKNQKVPQALMRAHQIIRWIHRPQDVVRRYLPVESIHQPRESVDRPKVGTQSAGEEERGDREVLGPRASGDDSGVHAPIETASATIGP